jgi:hypothetical protein
MSTTRTTTERDDELGAALRALDVPDHRPSFHAELRRGLATERRSTRQRGRRRLVLRVGAAAAVVAGVGLALGLPRGGEGPEPATAALIKDHMRAALIELRTLEGVLVADGPRAGDEQRWRFALDAAGDLRLEGPAPGEVITYNAAEGIVRSAQRSASTGAATLFYAERTGVAPGPPDQGPPTWLLPHEFGAYVRAALAAGDVRVRELNHDGRPAWQLDVDTVPNAIVPELSGDHFQITVDRATGLPVQVVETRHGTFLREMRLEHLMVNTGLAAGTFRLAFPTGAEVMHSDDGFRRVSLDEVAGIVGYRPLAPAWLPAGYRLAAVAVARESTPTGKEGGNPPSRMVVSLSYRRGVDQFLVTTRLRGVGTWSDPLATGEGFVDHPERVTLRHGALAGSTAELLIVPRGIPHLWTVNDYLVITVSGDLARSDLVRIGESLQSR